MRGASEAGFPKILAAGGVQSQAMTGDGEPSPAATAAADGSPPNVDLIALPVSAAELDIASLRGVG